MNSEFQIWFIPLFVALWLAVSGMLAHLSGWRTLAQSHAARRPPDGERITFSSMRLAALRWFPVSYRNCVTVTVARSGLGLSLFLPFRFLSPELFVPWQRIESVEETPGLFGSSARIRIADCAVKLTVYGRAAPRVITAWHRAARGTRGN